jgi:hypothetical protein
VNLEDTNRLLVFIARLDNRRVDDATVVAWQSILGELDLPDCVAAARQHFGESDAYLMPVHIRRGAFEIDRDRRRRAREANAARALEAQMSDPTRYDRSDEVRALIAQLRDALPDGDPDKLRRAEWVEHDKRRARLEQAEPNPHYDPSAVFAPANPGGPE